MQKKRFVYKLLNHGACLLLRVDFNHFRTGSEQGWRGERAAFKLKCSEQAAQEASYWILACSLSSLEKHFLPALLAALPLFTDGLTGELAVIGGITVQSRPNNPAGPSQL